MDISHLVMDEVKKKKKNTIESSRMNISDEEMRMREEEPKFVRRIFVEADVPPPPPVFLLFSFWIFCRGAEIKHGKREITRERNL